MKTVSENKGLRQGGRHVGTVTAIRPNGPATVKADDGSFVTVSRHLFGDGVGGNGAVVIGTRVRFELETHGVAGRIWILEGDK